MTLSYGQSDQLKKEIRRIILNDTDITLKETPGFIIAVVDGEGTHFVNFGSVTYSSKDTLNEQHVFELGSLSKVFTASLLSKLVHDEVLSYDDNINQYIPKLYRNPRLEDVSVMDLIHHYSSLPIRPHFFGRRNIDPDNPYKYYSKQNLLDFYRRYIPEKEDKGTFRYAHTNYALLEIVLEEATHKSFDYLMKKHIFEPLEMDNSFVFLPENRLDTLTTGHDFSVKKVNPWEFNSFAGSEGVKSSIHDLVHFVRANLGMSSTELDNIFSKNIQPELETNFNEYIKTGRGWQILRQKKMNIVTHSGRTAGHYAFIGLVEKTKTGVIVLANSATGTENLGLLILRMVNKNWKRKLP